MEQPLYTAGAPEQKGNGPVIGIIIVIIVLAIGAYYLFSELRSQEAARQADPSAQEAQMPTEQAVANIEGELQAEDLSDLEADIDADLQELDSAIQEL